MLIVIEECEMKKVTVTFEMFLEERTKAEVAIFF